MHGPRALALAAAATLVMLGAPVSAAAQATPVPAAPSVPAAGGIIDVDATGAEDGAPIAFALVRLLPAESASTRGEGALRQGVTSAGGRFRFVDVPAGDYRLQLARIGFRPVLSPVLRVPPGASVRHAFRGASQPVRLEAVAVRAGPACLTAAQLAEEPRVATLWTEARKGVETRHAFERQYRYTSVLRQDIAVQWRFRKKTREIRVDTTVNEPDSVRARDERLRSTRRKRGYAEGNLIALPRETELLDDAFLRDHCLDRMVAEAEGALGLRFRPVRRRRDGVDIRGTIWVAADGYQVRRLEFEYVEGDDNPFARSRLDYADVAVGGSTLRLATAGNAAILRPRGLTRATAKGATATFTFTYQEVQQVGTR